MTAIDYCAIVAFVIIALTMLVFLVMTIINATPNKRREIINQILYALAVEAERLYKGKTGQVKKKQVIAWFYERYKWLSLFITEAELNDWIDNVVDSMNKWMQSNPVGAMNLIGETSDVEAVEAE